MPSLGYIKDRVILLGKKGDPPFDFNPNLVSFTPKAAKRATSVFAAGILSQGIKDASLVGDVVTYPTGTAIAGYFYPTFDPYQGAYNIWWIPEYSSNGLVTGTARFKSITGNYRFYYDYSNNTFGMTVANQTQTASYTVTAGTRVHVVFSWDAKNVLDGTNYGRISINDVHTFGMSIQPTIATPGVTTYIGSNTTSVNNANGIIEGEVLYRRPLFDGSYGKDVGNGDEINLIYNSGTGQDPTLITGAQDICLCIPTDATPGQLSTGTGQAWSYPNASNVLTDGTFSRGYYGGGQWAVKHNGTSSYINCGHDANLDDIPLITGVFQVEGWAYKDGGTAWQFYVGKCVQNSVTPGGWIVHTSGGSQVGFAVDLATTNAVATSTASSIADKKWFHYVAHYNDATKKCRVAVDGVWGAEGSAGVGAYVSDVVYSLFIGGSQNYKFSGGTGWVRIHNHEHYTAGTNFVPPRAFPGADAGTVECWSMNDGTGTTAAATVNAANNGTITAGVWEPQWYPEDTPPLPVSLGGSGTCKVDVGSGATIDDLHDGAMTIEGWFRASKNANLSMKNNGGSLGWWLASLSNVTQARVYCATTSATATGATTITDNRWHHIAFTWDDAGDRKVRIFVDGKLDATSSAGVGAIISDAAISGYFGWSSNSNAGSWGWQRWSNSVRYTTTFTPPSRIVTPTPDANTMGLWPMTEGAGTAVADSSGNGNNGTVSGTYSWVNTPAMEYDAPGSRTFAWGEVIGSDAANDGIKQVITGLTPGANYALRVLCHQGKTGMSQPKVIVRDETNGADISYVRGIDQYEMILNGDFGSAVGWIYAASWSIAGGVAHSDGTQIGPADLYQTPLYTVGKLYKVTYTIANCLGGSIRALAGNNGLGTYRSSDGTFTETIRWAGNQYFTLQADADFIGDIDNVSVTPVSEDDKPEALMVSFQLPALCTSISVKLANESGQGMVYWHHADLQVNLLTNPSLDVGAGDPWIPTGWTNQDLDAGDSEREATITHSSGGCLQFNVGAASEYMKQALAGQTIGGFFTGGCWGYNSANVTKSSFGTLDNTNAVLQTSATANSGNNIAAGTSWKHFPFVGKYTSATPTFMNYAWSSGPAQRYIDDQYLIALDPITLTVTPASQANSLEGTGIRVDGLDSAPEPIAVGLLTATSGTIRWKATPRHSSADVAKFGVANPVVAHIYKDATNYIKVDFSAANTLRLTYNANGAGVQTATGAVALTAGTAYTFKVVYTAGGMTVYVNDVAKVTISAAVNFGLIPDTFYSGCDNTGANQWDAVFSSP